MRYKTILLDLDGTIVDSGEGITRSAQYALEASGIHEEDHTKLGFFVGPPLEDTFMSHYGMSQQEASKAVIRYRDRYLIKGVFEQSVYPGAIRFLESARDRGYQTAIATSKPQSLAEFVATHFGFRHLLDGVYGRDEQGILHTKSEVIEMGLKDMGISENRGSILMVGDTRFDIIGARECGMDSVGVFWGYGSRKEILTSQPTYTAASFEELERILEV